jgi:hypothetical protein
LLLLSRFPRRMAVRTCNEGLLKPASFAGPCRHTKFLQLHRNVQALQSCKNELQGKIGKQASRLSWEDAEF